MPKHRSYLIRITHPPKCQSCEDNMKLDEYNILLGIPQELPPKRRDYIFRKWEKRGWIKEGEFTDELRRIKDLVINKKHYIHKWDGRVVTVHFIEDQWGIGQSVGILEDHGDNGWHLFTAGTCQHIESSFFLD